MSKGKGDGSGPGPKGEWGKWGKFEQLSGGGKVSEFVLVVSECPQREKEKKATFQGDGRRHRVYYPKREVPSAAGKWDILLKSVIRKEAPLSLGEGNGNPGNKREKPSSLKKQPSKEENGQPGVTLP